MTPTNTLIIGVNLKPSRWLSEKEEVKIKLFRIKSKFNNAVNEVYTYANENGARFVYQELLTLFLRVLLFRKFQC